MSSTDSVSEGGDVAPQSSSDVIERHEDATPGGPSESAPAPHAATLGVTALAVGALGVVFGDLGTSPLYALQTVFAADHGRIPANRDDIYGVISMILWTLLIVVTFKYVALVMRADNNGEGGIMALVALVRRLKQRTSIAGFGALILLGVFGASLFFGDAMITPAISVLSAMEGLKVVSPSLGDAVVPLSLAVLIVLFAVQRFGTGTVGRLFGPVMVFWFGTIAVLGAAEVARHPGILAAVSPSWAVSFAVSHLELFLIAITGVVLCITGVEALYADMGHFGRPAITRAWLWVAFPALVLNYMGQGARVLSDPSARSNPFYLLVPSWGRVPMVFLATVATVIASQAVISGAFSLGRQAAQLGFLPRLTVRHTSHVEVGQVYLPAINGIVLVSVVLLIIGFGSSARLASAYGVAVTGTILITTVLFVTVARARWHIPIWLAVAGGVFFGGIDLLFFGVNLTKLVDGGWFPVAVGITVFLVFTTWDNGQQQVTAARERAEGPLRTFVEQVHAARPPLHRVPGTAVFLNANPNTTPWALRANAEHNHTLHEAVVIVSIEFLDIPAVSHDERVSVDDLGYSDDGIFHVMAQYGFDESPDVPAALALAAERGLERPVDLEQASYFVSRITLRRDDKGQGRIARWRKTVFLTMARHAASPVEYFNLPIDRTVVMGGNITV